MLVVFLGGGVGKGKCGSITLNVHYDAHSRVYEVNGDVVEGGLFSGILLGQMGGYHVAVTSCVIWFLFRSSF